MSRQKQTGETAMVGILMLLYSVLSYLVFFATFLYAIAFVGNLPVPKTIDSGAAGSLIPTLIVDAMLLGLFAVQHSAMARPAFKRLWTRIVAPPIERSTYVLASSAALIVLYVFWRPLPQPIWTVSGVFGLSLTVVFWFGWAVVLLSTFLINHFELFGLQQAFERVTNRPAAAPRFVTPVFYRLVRHPIYVGFILAFWATPRMSLGHLIFAVATTGYIVIAIQLEEHDLVAMFGERYRAYRRQAGMLWPKLWGRGVST
jgi:protein-S-isoprenylcysteine O-methyltransferase Ste14